MKLSIDQVKKTAKLANLPLENEEKYAEQLSAILDYIDQLNLVDTSEVTPTFNVIGKVNVWQSDQVETSLSQEQALANASQKFNGSFLTKGVFKDE